MTTGIELITKEREKQISILSYYTKKDIEKYPNGELLVFAAYLMKDDKDAERDSLRGFLFEIGFKPEYLDRLESKTNKERLIGAGAIIAAEIDRLNAIEAILNSKIDY